MLCPKCGTNVGDLLTLCERCKAERAEAAERSAAEHAAHSAANPAPEPRDNRRLIGILGGTVAVLMFALAGMLMYQQSAARSTHHLSSSDQALLSTHYNRCVTALSGNQAFFSRNFSEAEMKMHDTSIFSKLAPAAIAAMDPKEQCAEARDRCAEDLSSAGCVQWMKSNNIFFAAVKACQTDGFRSMGSKECQEFMNDCVKTYGPNGESAECANLLRRYGADSPVR